jgi:hypothetical protein
VKNEPAIDIVTAEAIRPGVVAHRRRSGKYDPKANNWISERWPACMPKPGGADGAEWMQRSASWAAHLGAVPCAEPDCFGKST